MRTRRAVAKAVLVVLGLTLLAGVAAGDRTFRTLATLRTKVRAYVGATPQQYDTLACNPGERIELSSFTFFGDDSAMTPTLNVSFQTLNSKTTVLKITPQAFTANQHLEFALPLTPVVFPKDSTILIYYNITSAAPGTLDTLGMITTYRVQPY